MSGEVRWDEIGYYGLVAFETYWVSDGTSWVMFLYADGEATVLMSRGAVTLHERDFAATEPIRAPWLHPC